MSHPTWDGIQEYRAKRADSKARRERKIAEIARYLRVPDEKVRVVLEYLESDVPLRVPIEKRRRRR